MAAQAKANEGPKPRSHHERDIGRGGVEHGVDERNDLRYEPNMADSHTVLINAHIAAGMIVSGTPLGPRMTCPPAGCLNLIHIEGWCVQIQSSVLLSWANRVPSKVSCLESPHLSPKRDGGGGQK